MKSDNSKNFFLIVAYSTLQSSNDLFVSSIFLLNSSAFTLNSLNKLSFILFILSYNSFNSVALLIKSIANFELSTLTFDIFSSTVSNKFLFVLSFNFVIYLIWESLLLSTRDWKVFIIFSNLSLYVHKSIVFFSR